MTSHPRAIFHRLLLTVLTVVLASWTASTAQTGTPSQFYLSYRAAFEKAQKIEDLLPFLAAENRQQVEKTPANERVELFKFMKMMGTMKDVKVVKTAKTANGEMLTVEGLFDGKKQTCSVQIVSESSSWKVGEEKCSGSV